MGLLKAWSIYDHIGGGQLWLKHFLGEYDYLFVLYSYLQDICTRTDGCEQSPINQVALGALSIIGTTLSLFGLTVTIITLLVFK